MSLYIKLAATNMKKNARTYIPYLLSCIGTVMMYNMMHTLSGDRGLDSMTGGQHIRMILSMGSGVIAFFSVIFLFYTNSFLIKRRKKEFGLYNIMGMEKKHISRMMFFETLYTALISLLAGIFGGMLMSKLMYLFLLKLLHFEVQMGFEVSADAIVSTITLFGVIFILTFLNTLRQIHLSNPVELLSGGNTGEREPKSKWLLALLGVVSLSAGYYIALTTESPLGAIDMFFLAVILVIIGTYALFVAGSVAVLKLLRKNKKYYYQTKHFTTVSGMIYRMKQNAVGLANICILSTAVLVMLSTTVSLYAGMENVLRTRFIRNILISGKNIADEQAEQIDRIIQEECVKAGITPENMMHYRSIQFAVIQKGNEFTGGSDLDLVKDVSKFSELVVMPLSEYNQMMGENKTLAPGEVLLYRVYGEIEGDTVTVFGNTFQIKERLEEMNVEGAMTASLIRSYYLVVPDRDTIRMIYQSDEKAAEEIEDLSYFYGFDVSGDSELQTGLNQAIMQRISNLGINSVYSECMESSRESFYALYGGMLFLGIFLGILFLMATVLIIYYKQVSEGFDDKKRFAVMQKVGMSRSEIKSSIRSQVLTVFFLPLVTAVIHIAAAFKVITKLLALLNLTDVRLFFFCTIATILVFAAIYSVVYALTARVYYKIVS